MGKYILSVLMVLVVASWKVAGQQTLPTYLDGRAGLEERVEDALRRMTLEEKVAMCHAQSKFSSSGVPRLGIPDVWMTDGPHGIRPEVLWDEWDQAGWTNDSCIAFPALTCLAATWDRDLSLLYGRSIGEEARYRKKDVLLGPGVNIYRTPLNGRNFEYMGEDPYLASQMVVPYVKGVQSNGVAACVKHYALNNQEIDRHTVNVVVDDRALYEIYLPAFKAAVQEGGAWAIMGAYNQYRNQWACQNQYLLVDILRKEWAFDGAVVSDWGGVNNTQQAVNNGLDMEFGSWTNGLSQGASNAYDNYYLAQPFLKMLRSGEVTEEVLDQKVRNILRLVFRTGMNPSRTWGSFGSPEHGAAGRRIAEAGIVLLKNKGNLLPLEINKKPKILVVGENAIKAMTVGGGSSSLKAKYEISPLDGLKKRLGNQAQIQYARGYVGDTGGEYNGVVSGQDLAESRPQQELFAEAVDLAQNSDFVIFIGGLNKSDGQDSEGNDRASLDLPYNQNELISQLVKANHNLIVVNVSGNAVAMPWVNQVPAIVQTWYNGSESGTALASILLGDVNPSGKLPFSFPVALNDVGAHKLGDYPGKGEVVYREGLFVGYRWFEKEKVRPLFPFGHGLSYTSFQYGKVTADKSRMTQDDQITISVDVTNTGSREGSEVVQLYVKDVKSSLPRPIKELKGFTKVNLKTGETKKVDILLDHSALAFFDAERHEWVAEPGVFEVIVGSSSSDVKGKVSFLLE
ncbi:MAG: glycoside hydrolase family 3 C-terminal domain-containing protein [Breznakibacter sp.]